MANLFNHAWLGGLFGDEEMADIWSEDTQLNAMLRFEAAWSRHGHLAGLWDQDAGEKAASAIDALAISPSDLAAGTAQDGVCVPALVKALKRASGGDAVHTGLTSQDVIDTATTLSVQASLELICARLQALELACGDLGQRFGNVEIMGRTRMQAALPIAFQTRLAGWSGPLAQHLTRIDELRPRVLRIQIGGAVGNRAKLGAQAGNITAAMAKTMGLAPSGQAWHTTRDGIAEFASLLSMITGGLGKMGQDIALMAQQGVDEIEISGGGGSSAMPHKQNPVLAELLVTLAQFNAAQLSAVHSSLVHEQERSGAAWALEWMVLPQMAMACARALAVAQQLITSIERIGLQA